MCSFALEFGSNRSLNFIYRTFDEYGSSGGFKEYYRKGGRHFSRWMPRDMVLGICFRTAGSPISGPDALHQLWQKARPTLKERYQQCGRWIDGL